MPQYMYQRMQDPFKRTVLMFMKASKGKGKTNAKNEILIGHKFC